MERDPTYSVMVSSTYTELIEHRRAVIDAMIGQRMLPLAMDHDAALPDQDLIDASLAKVNESDGYVGLISYRYGQMPECPERNPDKLSLTELEFRRAVAREIPICMFIMHGDHPVQRRAVNEERGAEQKLESFLQLARKDRIYAEFKSVEDLKAKVVRSLVALRKVLDRRALPTPQRRERGDRGGNRIALSNIPITVPRHFLGRDDAIEAIDAALKGEGRVAITALHGLRGVGKTTLAAAYAERRRGNYRATWWVRAQTEATMRADLVALGVRLGWVSADEKEEPALLAIRERGRDESKGLLLIYDSAVDATSLTPYLPPGGGARVIVTSTAPAWRGVAVPIELPVWTKGVGADYLVARTGRGRERADAEALSEALGGLPLAHEQAGAYCDRLGLSIGEYRKRFDDAPARLLDKDKDAPAEYHNKLTAAKAFALAIDEAGKLDRAAVALIDHAALLAPEPIPLFLFSEARERFGEPLATLLSDDGLDEAIAALRAFALVDRETIADERDPVIVTETIRLHRLVRTVAATRLRGEATEGARRALIEAMAAVYPKDVWDDPGSWPRARKLDALAVDLVDRSDDPPRGAEASTSYLLDKLASYRQVALGAYSQAKPLFAKALAIREKSVGLEHPDIARSLNNLAYLSQVQRDLPAARQLFERGLAIREKALGPEHRDTADSLNNLAYLLQEQRDYAGARPLFERALAIREKAFGPEHPDTARSHNNLAYLLQEQRDYAAARPLFERALAVREKALGPGHPDVATSFTNLGYLLKVKGDLAGARPFYERALRIHERACGPEHPLTATSLIHLADLLQAQVDFAGAQPLFERALTIRMKALGPEHPETNLARGNLARLRLAQGAPFEALALSEAALAVHDRVFGPNHDWTKDSARIAAASLEALDRADEARAVRAKYGLESGPGASPRVTSRWRGR